MTKGDRFTRDCNDPKSAPICEYDVELGDPYENVINFGYLGDPPPKRIPGVTGFDLRANCVKCGETVAFQPAGEWSETRTAYGQCPKCNANYRVISS